MKATIMKTPRKQILFAAFGLALGAAFALPAGAQTATPSNDNSFTKYGQEFKGKIGRTYAESQEWYPETTITKPGTPNVFLILLDDVGFSQYGCYGGLVDVSEIEARVAVGLRFDF